jgi:hypothetical protein
MKSSQKPLGIILYKGKSNFDGKNIIVIANNVFSGDKTENPKTGNMIQTYIIRPDISPIVAAKLGFDYSYCENCFHKHAGSCYVNLIRGPEPVFNAYHNDKYIHYTPDMLKHFENRNIRLGTFGDPAAVKTEIWDNICGVASGFCGYTHQWGNKKTDPNLKKYCMASCDTIQEQKEAIQKGWKTFRIRHNEQDTILENEFMCPASKEAGQKTNCNSCKGCMGISSKYSKNPCIIIHGADFKKDKFLKGIKKIKNKKKWRIDFKKRYKNLTLPCGS